MNNNGKKPKKGRSFRKRTRKLRGIEQAFLDYHNNHSNDKTGIKNNTNNDFIKSTLKTNDDFLIMKQLGFIPSHVRNVSSRICDFPKVEFPLLYQYLLDTNQNGKLIQNNMISFEMRDNRESNLNSLVMNTPTTIRLHPLQNNKPFPTLYWLTHPILKVLISQMEDSNTHSIGKLEQKLNDKNNDMSRLVMKKAHELYISQRIQLLSMKEKKYIHDKKWEDSIYQKGIAGIQNRKRIKCLHAHVAHYLVWFFDSMRSDEEVNVVGKWTLEGLEICLREGNIVKKLSTKL